ncbi:MAG TPA: hypothetical protein VK459_15575 [Polyangiaceae bacterium]|jgi:hypothetical protein|nr:hypothetical protein [Polyangiaceae bacterium]
MSTKLERRAYGPSSTPAEIAAIKERVSLYSGDIILYRELPVQSVFHLDLFEERLNELGAGMRCYDLLIDLTEAEFPSGAIRARLKRMFLGQKKLRNIAVFTGKNFVINTAAKFVLSEPGLRFSVHTQVEQALASLRLGSFGRAS